MEEGSGTGNQVSRGFPQTFGQKMYRTLTFKSKSDDEPEFNEAEAQIRPGSKDLAESIVEGLGRCSGAIVSPIDQHEYYGWAFSVQFDGGRFYNVLNPVEGEAMLTVSMDFFFIKRLLFRRPINHFNSYCALLASAVEPIDGISNLEWEPYRT